MSRDAAAVDSTVPPMVKKAVMRGGTGANTPNKKSRTTADGEEVFFSVGVGVTELTVGSVFASVLDVTVFSNIHNTSAWWCVAKLLCSTNQATISWILMDYNNRLSNNTFLPAFRITACYCLSKIEWKKGLQIKDHHSSGVRSRKRQSHKQVTGHTQSSMTQLHALFSHTQVEGEKRNMKGTNQTHLSSRCIEDEEGQAKLTTNTTSFVMRSGSWQTAVAEWPHMLCGDPWEIFITYAMSARRRRLHLLEWVCIVPCAWVSQSVWCDSYSESDVFRSFLPKQAATKHQTKGNKVWAEIVLVVFGKRLANGDTRASSNFRNVI